MRKKHKKAISRLVAKPRRNESLFDIWSIIHMSTGIFLGWIINPFIALSLMILWEPFEILILSPFLDRFGIVFGYESLRNSLSDIFFDVVGVALGTWALTSIVEPPFYLF
jgi:hypothetical protein